MVQSAVVGLMGTGVLFRVAAQRAYREPMMRTTETEQGWAKNLKGEPRIAAG